VLNAKIHLPKKNNSEMIIPVKSVQKVYKMKCDTCGEETNSEYKECRGCFLKRMHKKVMKNDKKD